MFQFGKVILEYCQFGLVLELRGFHLLIVKWSLGSPYR